MTFPLQRRPLSESLSLLADQLVEACGQLDGDYAPYEPVVKVQAVAVALLMLSRECEEAEQS